MKRIALLVTLVVIACTVCLEAAESSWRRVDGRSVALVRDGQVVWQFNYGADQTKPYFHPVALPGGPTLTALSPADHPWHYALWFSWKYIDKVNYWEEDRKTGLPAGRTSWSNVHIDTRDDGTATITMDIAYHLPDAEPVLTERRTVTVGAPESSGAYRMDWTSTFTAKQDVLLNRTPRHGPEGKAWGGYAGLSIRYAEQLQQREATTAEGPVTFEGVRAWPLSIGADYSGTIDGAPVGIAVLDHPDNPRHPTPWYLIRSDVMSYLNAALLANDALAMRADQAMTLRYRLIVHPRRWSAQRIKTAHDAWLAE